MYIPCNLPLSLSLLIHFRMFVVDLFYLNTKLLDLALEEAELQLQNCKRRQKLISRRVYFIIRAHEVWPNGCKAFSSLSISHTFTLFSSETVNYGSGTLHCITLQTHSVTRIIRPPAGSSTWNLNSLRTCITKSDVKRCIHIRWAGSCNTIYNTF